MRNDTEHLFSSPANAARLIAAMKGPFRTIEEIYSETLKEPIPENMKRLLDALK